MRWLFHREEGQALVEMAFVLPVFLLLVIGLFDLGRAVFQVNTLAYAAREGTRYAIVHGQASEDPVAPGNESDVVNVVRDAAIGVTAVSVAVTWPDLDGYNPGCPSCVPPIQANPGVPCTKRSCRVAVDATALFQPMLSQWFGVDLRLTLRAGSMLVIQR
jgi:hypothetical protein